MFPNMQNQNSQSQESGHTVNGKDATRAQAESSIAALHADAHAHYGQDGNHASDCPPAK